MVFFRQGMQSSLFIPEWGLSYKLRDDYRDTVAQGSVNGTPATPGPGVRAVVDTHTGLSLSGGNLVLNTATGADGDPGIWYGSISRLAGRLLVAAVNVQTSRGHAVSFSSGSGVVPSRHGIDFWFGGIRVAQALDIGAVVVDAYATTTQYYAAIILRASGAWYLIKGGTFSNWSLLFVSVTETISPLFPMIKESGGGAAAACNFDFARMPAATCLLVPLASDSFNRANGAIGSTDGAGHAEANGGGGLAWTAQAGTPVIAGNMANFSALTGGLGIATVPTGSKDVWAEVPLTRTAGAGGLMLRYTDASNYLYAYHDGTNAALVQRVSGTETNVVAPAAATYGAGKRICASLDGNNGRLYYGDALVGSGTINAALTGTAHGLYANNTNPTLDNLVIWPRGTGNEFLSMNRFIR